MILLWGIPGDGPLAAVRRELQRRGAAHLFVDQFAVLESDLTLAFGRSTSGTLRTPDGAVDLEEVAAAYVRPYDSERVLRAAERSDGPARARAGRFDDALQLWCEVTGALVVNRLSAMSSNRSKPWQSTLIAAAGFAVPETLLTTDPARAAAFRERWGEVIYKSLSGIRSTVATLDDQRLARIAGTACPVQLQRRIAGTDVRVHVVGDEAFACEILTAATDYRYPRAPAEEPRLAPCVLPEEVRLRCLELARMLGLVAAGVDLRRGDDGRWVCFEVNPSPAFTYYQAATGQPIAAVLADLLIAARGARPAAAPKRSPRGGRVNA